MEYSEGFAKLSFSYENEGGILYTILEFEKRFLMIIILMQQYAKQYIISGLIKILRY